MTFLHYTIANVIYQCLRVRNFYWDSKIDEFGSLIEYFIDGVNIGIKWHGFDFTIELLE